MRVTKLKPGTHMHSGLIYCVYRKKRQGLIIFGVNPMMCFTSCIPESGPRAYLS